MKNARFLCLILLCILITGCDGGRNSTSSLTVKTRPEAADINTAVLLSELTGLLSLTDSLNRYGEKPQMQVTTTDSLLIFSIRPKLSDQNQRQMEQLLDRLIANPPAVTAYPYKEAAVKITETSEDLLKLLKVNTGDQFPFKVLPETVVWEYNYSDRDRIGGLIDVQITPYLVFRLDRNIPSLAFGLGLGNRDDEGQNETQQLIASILRKMPPGSIDFSIQTGNVRRDSLWNELRNNYGLSFADTNMSVRLPDIDFEMIFPSSLSDDEVTGKSIAKLMEIHPLVYHLLLAPELSRTIQQYHFE